MEKKIMKIKSCVISGQRNLKENICRFFTERKYISGITVIELVLILVIVIALLLIFKTELINLINSIFDKITSESSGISLENMKVKKAEITAFLSLIVVLLISHHI